MPRMTGSAAVEQRRKVLALRQSYPNASYAAIGHMVQPNASKFSVRAIVKRFEGKPVDIINRVRNEAKHKSIVTKRWRRYIDFFLSV